MSEIRRELAQIRDALYPAGEHRLYQRYRHPRIGGLAPVGGPRHRRSRCTAPRSGTPRSGPSPGPAHPSVPDIHRALHAGGYALTSPQPVEQFADALGNEHEKGRARRIQRGVYEIGELSPHRRRKALASPRAHDLGHEQAGFGRVEPDKRPRAA